MDEIPQGGAGGVPLHHDPQDDSRDPRAPGPVGKAGGREDGPHGPHGSEDPAEAPSQEQGDATTVEPGRARRLGSDERDDGPGPENGS
ncbi:hypothetical protein [Streptomyces sp. 1331.2]|uniref:hypothetical protein n=1 Tax=Streptomyces sp. 1331.2 TaxID=1938835 RepID=UPI000BC38C7E|nr:hypothetical protein [Streptomyces sp. 1331.2]SOB85682.1 hypothetical protein SAMN06272789_5973 [Streptomyces sp. 1331.2]